MHCVLRFWRLPIQMEDRVRCALEHGDPAGLCSATDLQSMASAVVQELQSSKPLVHPATTCPGCGREGRPWLPKAVNAVILDVDGLRNERHIPRRCQKQGCLFCGKALWQNFFASGRGSHIWNYPQRELPQIIMVSTKFGVTKRWYKQFSCRLLKQYASWWGEGEVHTARNLQVLSPASIATRTHTQTRKALINNTNSIFAWPSGSTAC